MEKTYKRKTREVSPETKQKISSSLTSYNATHRRSDQHNHRIADGLRNYWSRIPSKPSLQDKLEDGDIV